MSKGHQLRMEALRRAAAHLDEGTLDRVWQAALRGDIDIVEKHLGPYLAGAGPQKEDTWRTSSSWLFGRESFNRR